MADPRFFTRRGPFSLRQIADQAGAVLKPEFAGLMVNDVAPLDTAEVTNLSFIDNRKYRDQFQKSRAGACFMRSEMAALAPSGMVCLVTPLPYKSYAYAAQMFYPESQPLSAISEHAIIDVTAVIGEACRIDAGVVIGPGAHIGAGSWIESNSVIGENVQIGTHCRIGPNASVAYALIGHHVRLYPGVRVGQDGFGFAIDPTGHVKVPQLGRVIIEDNCEIGANTCIDRGTIGDTVIGTGTWIDNLVQIAHNVKIGRGCIIVAQVGISGSSVLEDYVALGGQAGVAGHLHIGKGAQIAAQSGVIGDIPAGETYMGYPALPKTQFMRHVAYLNRMTKRTGLS